MIDAKRYGNFIKLGSVGGIFYASLVPIYDLASFAFVLVVFFFDFFFF